MDSLRQDLRYALRQLARDRGFAAVAILTLGLGIGATTAIFSVVHQALLRPLPFPDPGRLVQVWETRPGEDSRRVAPANYLDWRRAAGRFEGLSAYDVRAGNLLGGDRPDRLTYATVSADFFRTLGVEAERGRTFSSDDADARGSRAAVLSHQLWQGRFGGDAAVLGRTVRLDQEAFTVVGVMPPGFDFPGDVKLWIRAPFDVPELDGFPGDITQLRDAWYFRVVGRLSGGADLDEAQSEMDVIARRLEADHPVSNLDAGARLVPLRQEIVGDARDMLLVLLGAVAFVLLIACANVANLTLVRASRRAKELAIRTALGAARGRLAVQLLSETAVLGIAGGGLGVLLAFGSAAVLQQLLPAEALVLGGPGVNGSVLLFALGLTFLAAVGSGTLPAMIGSRVPPGSVLGERGSSGGGTVAGRRARSAIVVAQCALAIVLVVGASLMLKSLWNLQSVDPGFRPEGLQTVRLSIPAAEEGEPGGAVALQQEILARVEGVGGGGVSAAIAMSGPTDDGPGAGLRVEGRPANEGALPDNSWQVVSPGYFRTAGIALLRGRAFDRHDTADSEPVAVINRTMADRHWPGEDPIGRRVNTGLDGEGIWVTIVGVAEDTKNEGLAAPPAPEMFRPLGQPTRGFRGQEAMLLVRSEAPRRALLQGIRRAVWDVRPDIPVFAERTGNELLGASTAEPRSILLLLALFAGLALTLGAIGIHGVLAYAVSRRSHEIGVRVALGATPGSVLALVLRSSLALVALGLGVGLAAAVPATRALRGMLFQVTTADPAVHVIAAFVLLCVGLAASLVPARRATRVDPLVALRHE